MKAVNKHGFQKIKYIDSKLLFRILTSRVILNTHQNSIARCMRNYHISQSIACTSRLRVTKADAGNGRIITWVSGSDVSDSTIPDFCSCCRSDRKVGEPRDSVWFRTDAGVKVGHGSRGANEQADFSVEASPLAAIVIILHYGTLSIEQSVTRV